MIVHITQELIDRMQHTEEECAPRSHFPCLTEAALAAALGKPVHVGGDYSDYRVFDGEDNTIGYLSPEGQAALQAYDQHQPLSPVEFEVLP